MANKQIHHGNGVLEYKGKNGSSWGVYARVNGKRIRRFGLPSREEAELTADEIKQSGETLAPFVGRATGCGNLKIGAVGATAELLVCADLLQQGFDVFRSVSINAACDVIASNDKGTLCRIEVKSAIHRKGVTRFKRHRFDRTKHDVLALVFLREQTIQYSQDLVAWFEEKETSPKYSFG